MYGEPVRYSTKAVPGMAEASWRSAARPSAVFQPCGTNATPLSSAIQAIRRDSLIPPTLVDVGLDDVEGAALEPRQERLAAGQDLAAGDRDAAVLAQQPEVVEGVGRQRLLEPADVVLGEHVRRPERPLVAVRPERVAAAGIDHQRDVRPDRLARAAHDRLVRRGARRARTDPSRA